MTTHQEEYDNEQMVNDDYDNPWKEILEHYFREFLELLFPDIASEIDWSREYTFLDKELQKVVRDAKEGKLYADKLAQVYRKDGNQAHVMIHVEVQSQKQMDFATRMLVYNCRLSDLYQVPIVSLAVLGDAHPHWRPNTVTRELWGCNLTFTYPIAKLDDYRDRWDELEASDNPFALVIMTHLKTQETHRNHKNRRRWKVTLVRLLYAKGYTTKQAINLLHFIDWIMWLPEKVNTEVWNEIKQSQEGQKMPYMMSIERVSREEGLKEGLMLGEKKGIVQGLHIAIELGVKLRFGSTGQAQTLLPCIQRITDSALLQRIVQALETATTLDDIQQLCSEHAPVPSEQTPTA